MKGSRQGISSLEELTHLLVPLPSGYSPAFHHYSYPTGSVIGIMKKS